MAQLRIPVSVGEVIDKITILEIKVHHLHGQRRQNVQKELSLLQETLRNSGVVVEEQMRNELKSVNQRLWDIEDKIRDQERVKSFGDEFIALARSVYVQNDLRAALKRRINVASGSELVEEKAYREY